MIHVFSIQDKTNTQPPPGYTLLHEHVQNSLLEEFSPNERPKMKIVLSHFARHTIPTFSPVRASDTAWLEALPLLATHHPFVLHAILAVGYLHLSTLSNTASEKDEYQDIAATQINAGMTQYRIEVQNITTSNAEALFAFSAMVTMFVLPTTATECRTALESLMETNASEGHHNEIVSNLVSSMSRIFRTMRGVLVIIVPYYYHICSGKLEPVMTRSWWPPPIPVTAEEIEQDQKLRCLEKMWSQPGKTYEYCFDALRDALKTLRESSALVSRLASSTFPSDGPDKNKFDWTSILQWPVGLPFNFILLLEQQRMEAWVLMAHYALQPAKATANPWLNGFATNLVTTSAFVIGEENWEWITWPAEVVGINLESLRNTKETPQHSGS
jgi:hypothetical protein